MKKALLFFAILFLSLLGYAQGDTTGRSDLAYIFQTLLIL